MIRQKADQIHAIKTNKKQRKKGKVVFQKANNMNTFRTFAGQ